MCSDLFTHHYTLILPSTKTKGTARCYSTTNSSQGVFEPPTKHQVKVRNGTDLLSLSKLLSAIAYYQPVPRSLGRSVGRSVAACPARARPAAGGPVSPEAHQCFLLLTSFFFHSIIIIIILQSNSNCSKSRVTLI